MASAEASGDVDSKDEKKAKRKRKKKKRNEAAAGDEEAEAVPRPTEGSQAASGSVVCIEADRGGVRAQAADGEREMSSPEDEDDERDDPEEGGSVSPKPSTLDLMRTFNEFLKSPEASSRAAAAGMPTEALVSLFEAFMDQVGTALHVGTEADV